MDGNDAKREIARSHKNPTNREMKLRSLLLYMDESLIKNLDPTEQVPRVGGCHKLGSVPRMVGRAGVYDTEHFMMGAALVKRLRNAL